MTPRSDVIVIGAGIVGLAHALAARRAGLTVQIIERNHAPVGASIRNFGMVWPIGQSIGEGLDTAARSREIWLEVAPLAGFAARASGSLHLAHEDDELAVIREFCDREAHWKGRDIEVLSPDATLARCPHVNPRGLRGALWSRTELAVDPRQALARLFEWVTTMDGVRCNRALAVAANDGVVTTSAGETFEADRILVCSGPDTQTLFPEVIRDQGLTMCKLQMMRTAPQPASWRLDPHIAGGLTLCHYAAFRACPSTPALAARFRAEMPEYLDNGIHVMASQNHLGELVIGDSHHYGDDALWPFDSARVNELILAYLDRLIVAPSTTPAATWNGVYPKFTDGRIFLIATPIPGVTVVNGVGGAGMTLSFGLAERVIARAAAAAPF